MESDSEKSSLKSTEARKEGNELFLRKNRDEYRRVLSLYSKSIAYAPLDSEELALAYGNRSVLWLYLQKYNYCLIDIARALSITKSNDLVQKLSSRKKECLNRLNKKKEQKKSKPFMKTSSGAEGSIAVECNMKYGRHYVATRNIKPGEIVMCEKAQCASVNIEHMYLVCSHCLAFAWAGIPCNSCTFTVYCSETCMEEAWSQYHEVICALYSIDSFSHHIIRYLQEIKMQRISYQNSAFGIFMGLLRMMIILLKKEGLDKVLKAAEEVDKRNDVNLTKMPNGGTLNCSDFKYLYGLSACRINMHECLINLMPTLRDAFEKASSNPFKNCPNETISSMQSVFEKLYRICESNEFKFSSYDCTCKDSEGSNCITDRGFILAPSSSLFNHSCDHNVDRIFLRGPRMMLHANRPIRKGEQLFVNYGCFLSMTQSLRQMALKSAYSFVCECIPCTENWPELRTGEVSHAKQWVADLELMIKRLSREQVATFFNTPMVFNEKFFNTVVELLDFIYRKLKGPEAADNAYLYQRYIIRYLSHSYDEDVDLHHIWDITKTLEERMEGFSIF